MTRKEQIIQAAKQAEKEDGFAQIVKDARGVNSAYGIGFLEGAEWADNHSIETNEGDLEKELETLDSLLYDLDGVAVKGTSSYLTVEDVKDIAKRFYELGLKTRKGG